jgi:hypothetical protein
MRCKLALMAIVGLFLLPAFAAADPPAESGIVIRMDVGAGAVFYGNNGTRMVIYGVDPIEFCVGVWDPDTWTDQMNLLPHDEIIVDLFKGDDVRTWVYPFADFDCALILNVPPLATGTSDVVWTDNNLYGEDTNRANSWNVSAHGVLTDENGEEYVFQHNLHCTWIGYYDDDATTKCHSKIRLR